LKKEHPSPPHLALRFFRWYCHPKLLKYIEGDLMELYEERVKAKGKRKADIRFIIDVLLLFRPGIIRPAEGYKQVNQYGMFKSYFKIGWRNLWKNKSYSFINISGLAVGMTTCVLIMLYVLDEQSYDKQFKESERIYRIASETRNEKWVALAAPVAEALKNDFPEVEQVTRLLRFPGAEKVVLSTEKEGKRFFENNTYYADSTFFQLFNYDFKYGDVHSALNQPNSMVISEKVAARFFGDENPVDKVVKVGLSFGDFTYTIKGVLKDSNSKSHIPVNLILSMNNGDVGGWVKQQTNWSTNSIFHTYAKLRAGVNSELFERKLNAFLMRNGGEDFKASGFDKKLFIQPLEDIYLYSNYGYEVAVNGNAKHLYIFVSIAVFLLLIACINFMNLSTARSEKRAKEVGLRKTVGAGKGSLISQFLSESLLMSVLALLFSFVLIQFLLPGFNALTGKQLSLFQTPNVIQWLITLTLGTGLLSGIYPAFYLSSFKPVTVLKGTLRSALSVVTIRKSLVVFQFTISIVLILGAIVIKQQMIYLSNQNLGFNKNQKIILPVQTEEANANSETLANEIQNDSRIVTTTKASAYPGMESIMSMLFYAEGKPINDNVELHTVYVEPGYVETLGIQLLRGRTFSKAFIHDENALVLNETAVNQLGYSIDNAVGRKVYYEFRNETKSMDIIGVVKDYHFQSLHQKIKPLALSASTFFSSPISYLILDVKGRNYADLITSIQKSWNKVNPASPFAYSFLDQDFQKNYQKEEQTSQLIQNFTLVAIFIACMGLFGLAMFTSEQRTKEIGVRKVLGASVSQITLMLSSDFLKLVLISILLSAPLAYYVMTQWLHDFAYRIAIEWWVFILAGAIAIFISVLTMSYQAIKAASMNPVKSLRSE